MKSYKAFVYTPRAYANKEDDKDNYQMERSGIILRTISLITLTILILTSCFSGEGKEEDFDNLNRQDFNLKQAIGEYYNIPSQDESEYPNYRDFGLKKGDSIVMRINSDSSFFFNHFYYENLIKVDSHKGRVLKQLGEKDKIEIPFPNNALSGLQGFLKTNHDNIYFYVQLNIKNYTNYEYKLMYKKKRNSD